MRGTVSYTVEELAVSLPTPYGPAERTLSVEFEAAYEVSAFDPGCTYGPPENCYPPEGGEIESVEICPHLLGVNDGEDWPDSEIAEHTPAIRAALEKWYAADSEPLDEKIIADARDRDDEPDFDPAPE